MRKPRKNRVVPTRRRPASARLGRSSASRASGLNHPGNLGETFTTIRSGIWTGGAEASPGTDFRSGLTGDGVAEAEGETGGAAATAAEAERLLGRASAWRASAASRASW